jgi:hypothetical protein
MRAELDDLHAYIKRI